MSSELIDWKQVKQLETDVGPEEFGAIVEVFLSEVEDEVNLLRNSAPDAEDLARRMHAMRGSARYLGFATFAERCAEIESKAANAGADSSEISELIVLYEKSRAAFSSAANGQEAKKTA